MSVSTEVQRTLVKSPPELWAELSDAERLTRHLGDIGEIRITKVEPESKVEWESAGASGLVQLKQSGWGTKVTLSVTRELPTASDPLQGEDGEVEADASAEPAMAAEPEPGDLAADAALAQHEPVRVLLVRPQPLLQPQPAPEVEATPASSEPTGPAPAARPGFFARLFRRRRIAPTATGSEPAREPEAEAAPQTQAEPRDQPEAQAAPEPVAVALAAPDPVYPERAAVPEPSESAIESVREVAAELADMEAQMERETARLLTAVLDRLGAAHHRPFSRG